MTERHRSQQALLQSLRDSGDPALVQRAEALQQQYHDFEKALLADDVYDAAKGEGRPPVGWRRGSDDLPALRAAFPGLPASDERLMALLKPKESGFRAEIYLPDPAVLGPGHKPTLVFKGSSGQVRGPDGTLRDTTAEDFIANNFPQSVGLRTDYYDRAMELAVALRESPRQFDLAGHSLAGGMASAASAVTGMRATTFNAAGLHPVTAPDYARRHGLALYDTDRTVTAYQVRGELLNDGVQDNLRNLGAIRQAQLGAVLKETATLLHEVPQGRMLLENALHRTLPRHAHDSANAFVEHLATRNAAQLVRELPLAAGRQQPPLAPMTERDGELVQRLHAQSLRELSPLARPVMNAVHAAAAGARFGREGGEAVAATGRIAEQALGVSGSIVAGTTRRAGDLSAQATQGAGAVADAAIRQSGDTLARGRETIGVIGAQVDRLQGQVQGLAAELGAGLLRKVDAWTPGDRLEAMAGKIELAGQRAEQANREEAEAARRAGREAADAIRARADAVAGTVAQRIAGAGELTRGLVTRGGQLADDVLDGSGRAATGAGARAPVAGAALGSTAAGSVAFAVQHAPNTFSGALNSLRTTTLAAQARTAGTEAFERHLMTETVVPSLNHRIAGEERAVREGLRDHDAKTTAPGLDGAGASARPASEAGQFLDRFIDAIQRKDPTAPSVLVADYARTDGMQAWMAQGREGYASWQQEQQRQAAEAELAQRQQASQGFARTM
ncbi:phospholipase [Luteimonas aestuarii]|uniref:Phospholipase n=1 Tax=Luteimonas aestuarii TaxID=453837 RepID=A0A4R5TTQ0_9GAMM|nr:phospholipase [Luteimonas aestuarii]TDK24393.1 phospholipase [Luteimonas aestuarii]